MPKKSFERLFTSFITLFTEYHWFAGLWYNIFTPSFKLSNMETNGNTNNTIFAYAFTGVLLFIAAVGFEIAGLLNATAAQLPYIAPAFVLGSSSVWLLYKAIRHDRQYRFRRM